MSPIRLLTKTYNSDASNNMSTSSTPNAGLHEGIASAAAFRTEFTSLGTQLWHEHELSLHLDNCMLTLSL